VLIVFTTSQDAPDAERIQRLADLLGERARTSAPAILSKL